MHISIHFGAGKIGRGFIGAVLAQAGYDVCFADVNQPLIDLINKEKQYTVRILDYQPQEQLITGISALNSNSEQLRERFAQVSLVTTAVSIKVLPYIVGAIVGGLRYRRQIQVKEPMNIVCCENGIRATSQLKEMVYKELTDEEKEWTDQYVGFADSSVDRIVPLFETTNPLDVAVEQFFEWNIDKTQLKGTLPKIEGLHLTNNLTAHIERKLFTVNTGHCATAFLGNIKGYTYIDECLQDAELKQKVQLAMMQSGAALCAKFGMDMKEQEAYINLVLRRFSNPYLKDLTFRVGHDPKRKLGPTLYFAYPISMALEQGLPTEHLAYVTAAGLREQVKDDPQCTEIAQLIEQQGLQQAITTITGITHPGVITQIAEAFYKV